MSKLRLRAFPRANKGRGGPMVVKYKAASLSEIARHFARRANNAEVYAARTTGIAAKLLRREASVFSSVAVFLENCEIVKPEEK
jgi:hypothetical protein